jgi:magnesium transporter
MSTGLVELYLSVTNNRMTDVMRVLTVIATVFIPPTFVVGVYGMNFDRHAGPLSMPELGWPLGYVGVMGLSLLMMLGMLLYFKRKGWF